MRLPYYTSKNSEKIAEGFPNNNFPGVSFEVQGDNLYLKSGKSSKELFRYIRESDRYET